MPTPDETAPEVLPTPPNETSSSRASFASCPPEEEREAHAPREAREEVDAIVVVESRHAGIQEPTPEPDVRPGAMQINLAEEEGKQAEHIEDVGMIVADSPSPVGSPDMTSDGDGRPPQSMTAPAQAGSGQMEEAAATYLSYPSLPRNQPLPTSTSSFLRPGSKFKGTQQSDRQIYDVQVEIKDVDLAESSLCGYLRIQGLTDDHPTLTTFFEGEIIGPKHLFRTTHPSWNSSEKIDLQHWARFPPFRPLAKNAKSSNSFTLKNYLDREHLFMRWKEYFLVPDHRVKSISGASFEGFYYICFDQRVGTVEGIYFHAKSEKYQQLKLEHVGDGGCVGSVEFR